MNIIEAYLSCSRDTFDFHDSNGAIIGVLVPYRPKKRVRCIIENDKWNYQLGDVFPIRKFSKRGCEFIIDSIYNDGDCLTIEGNVYEKCHDISNKLRNSYGTKQE